MSNHFRVLVTSGRFQPATSIVRALHTVGVQVDAADSYQLAPALHSNAVQKIHVVPSPSREPLLFAQAIADIVRERQIDLVIPTFEEGFYLARYAETIPTPIFTPPFDVLVRLHHKFRFIELCNELGLQAPTTVVATTQDELREAITQFDSFVARPAFSRGGQIYLTNHGPRAGESTINACEPTADNPWLVQPYIDGADACSFSIVRDGKIMVHCIYEPTIPSPGGWSIQFSSIKDFGTYEAASTISEKFSYSGFLSFDYRRTEDGFVLIECNPRLSAGAFITPASWIGDALLGNSHDLQIVESGRRCQYDAYLLDPHIIKLPPGELIRQLLTTPDALMQPEDVLPALYFLIGRRHWSKVAKQQHTSVGRAFLEDILWDGSPMPDP